MIKFPLGRNLANKDKCCKETLLSVQRSDFSPTEGDDGGLYHLQPESDTLIGRDQSRRRDTVL